MGGSQSSPEEESQAQGCAPCCRDQCGCGEMVEPPSPKKGAMEMLEDGLNAQSLANVGHQTMETVNNAVSFVADGFSMEADSPQRTGAGSWFGPVSTGAQANTFAGKAKDFVAKEYVEVRSFIQHSHITVKLCGLICAVALVVTSILGMLGLFGAEFRAFQYVHASWNIVFAVLMLLMDAKPEWLGNAASWQQRLWEKAPSLSKSRGRALIHFYVGTINLAMFPTAGSWLWQLIYICMGGSLCACGVLMLLNHHTYQCHRRRAAQRAQQSAAASVQHAFGVLKEEALEVKAYIMANHCSVRIFCFLIALALMTTSVLGMLNFFEALFDPFQYLQGAYNILFALLIITIDGQSGWFMSCADCQNSLFSAYPCLTSQAGRAAVHFYVGSINIVMLPGGVWDVIYVSLGGALILASLLMVVHFNWCTKLEMRE
eukprot:TRINITY_DN83077_c0_g1_i1.p1 TRINITY_DN83077_c0_g1~~TRINITY_DN83077_c0_g1_i1.p1  ORF type:complete len:430 (+),score=75.87 TRINITY_DN83077_c0_g1_i1:37-1326(+)